MWNLKINTNELIYKTETDSQMWKITYGYQRGKSGGGINQEYGFNRYTPLYVKQINNKDLLYSTGNYIQLTYNGKELEKNICITKSLFCTPETNTIL